MRDFKERPVFLTALYAQLMDKNPEASRHSFAGMSCISHGRQCAPRSGVDNSLYMRRNRLLDIPEIPTKINLFNTVQKSQYDQVLGKQVLWTVSRVIITICFTSHATIAVPGTPRAFASEVGRMLRSFLEKRNELLYVNISQCSILDSFQVANGQAVRALPSASEISIRIE
jgi:hypothetical protein